MKTESDDTAVKILSKANWKVLTVVIVGGTAITYGLYKLVGGKITDWWKDSKKGGAENDIFDNDESAQIAALIFKALDGWNNYPMAFQAIEKARDISAVAKSFKNLTSKSLNDYLQDQLYDWQYVQIMAVINKKMNQQTAVAGLCDYVDLPNGTYSGLQKVYNVRLNNGYCFRRKKGFRSQFPVKIIMKVNDKQASIIPVK